MLQTFLSVLDLLIIRQLILPLRLMQSILLLMVHLCRILLYIALLLAAWYISLLLVRILHMQFMLLASSLPRLLQFIGQLFFVFYDIFEDLSFRAYCFRRPLL